MYKSGSGKIKSRVYHLDQAGNEILYVERTRNKGKLENLEEGNVRELWRRVMKKVVVKIGADILDDMDKMDDPEHVEKSPDNIVYFKNIKQLASVLSLRKLGLLKYLSEVTGKTVTIASIELNRKKEAVSRDLHQLESLGFVQLQKRGRKVYPKGN